MKAISLVLAVAAGISGCASSGTRDTSYEKSPFLAEVLAIFPGIFVHGLGNLYAGKTERAEELMGEEGLSIGALGLATGLTFLGVATHRHADHSTGVEEIYGRIEEASSFLGAAVFAVFGVIFFFDSWIRDMVEAPGAAEERNRELRRLHEQTMKYKAPDTTAAEITSSR